MDTREWVKMWQRTGKLLEEIKARELRGIDTAAAIRSFEGLDVEARRLYPPADQRAGRDAKAVQEAEGQMTNLFHLADELQRFMDAKGWKFCFIGGLAVQPSTSPSSTSGRCVTGRRSFSGLMSLLPQRLRHWGGN